MTSWSEMEERMEASRHKVRVMEGKNCHIGNADERETKIMH